jgi:hypothetical protein
MDPNDEVPPPASMLSDQSSSNDTVAVIGKQRSSSIAIYYMKLFHQIINLVILSRMYVSSNQPMLLSSIII